MPRLIGRLAMIASATAVALAITAGSWSVVMVDDTGRACLVAAGHELRRGPMGDDL